MDEDLASKSADELQVEVLRLRRAIRQHRDSSGHALCWHHPELWSLLPEPLSSSIAVPEWPKFLAGCIRYRQSLDEQLPNAPRAGIDYSSEPNGKTYIWRSTLGSNEGLEAVHWGDGWAEGMLLAFTPEEGAFDLGYQLRWRSGFEITRVTLACWNAEVRVQRVLERTADDRWMEGYRELSPLRGCTDFDLWPTPFTNTLAVRRLGLEIGERRELRVAYFSAPQLTFSCEHQVYERLDHRRYRFTDVGTDFVADLELDSDGLVEIYPGLFRGVQL